MIEHSQHLADKVAMAATRMLLASRPMLAIEPASRAAFAEFMSSVKPAPGVEFKAETIAGVPGWWCLPPDAMPDAALVHLHGGGYVVGSATSHRNFVSHLAGRSAMAAFVPDYALAPEEPFPAAYEQILRILDYLQTNRSTDLSLSGDSAGGGLALAVAQVGAPPLRALLAFSPWADLSLSSLGMADREVDDPLLSPDVLARAADLYAGTNDRSDPRMSPRFGPMDNLPPLMIHVGRDEILLSDAIAVGAAAQKEGVATEVHAWAGMAHVFPASVDTLTAAREAIEISAAFLRENCRRSDL